MASPLARGDLRRPPSISSNGTAAKQAHRIQQQPHETSSLEVAADVIGAAAVAAVAATNAKC